MKKHMKKLAIIIIISWIPIFGSSAIAESSAYLCIINHVYSLSDKGIINTSASGWNKVFEGNEFTVSKSDGSINGQTLTTLLANETKVINSGSDENSFKAIAYFKDQVQVIEIQEFKSGKNKPFVAFSMGGVGIVSGICQ